MAIEHNKGGTVFTGRHTDVFVMTVVAKALRLYAATGMKVNRAYTPKAMIAKAELATGKRFKSRDYLGAAAALEHAAQELAKQPD